LALQQAPSDSIAIEHEVATRVRSALRGRSASFDPRVLKGLSGFGAQRSKKRLRQLEVTLHGRAVLEADVLRCVRKPPPSTDATCSMPVEVFLELSDPTINGDVALLMVRSLQLSAVGRAPTIAELKAYGLSRRPSGWRVDSVWVVH